MLVSCQEDNGSATATDGGESGGPDFETRYHTSHVDIAPGFTQPVCQGTLDEIDRHVDVVADLLDIDTPPRSTWYWFNESATGARVDVDRCDWCENCTSCYRGAGAVVSSVDAILHELVHSVVEPAWGGSDILFFEGVAIGLDRIEEHGTVHTVLSDDDDELPSNVADSHYGGGHFTRWLLDRYGPEKFRQLFGPPLSESSTKAEVFEFVEQVYGVPFLDLEAEYLASAPTIYPAPGLCDGLMDIPWTGDRWELSVSADCEAAHVFGPLDTDASEPADVPAPVAVAVTLEIPADLEGVDLAAWIPSNQSANLFPCFDAPLYGVDPAIASTVVLANPLVGAITPGRYRLELPAEASAEVYLRVCPHNGAPPSLDPTEDPAHCVGD
jgi:hypothetical protein